MAKLYEIHGIPGVPLDGEPPSYARVYSASLWDGSAPFSDAPFGLMPGDLRLWGQAAYWTPIEAALLLSNVPPDDPDLYAVVKEVETDGVSRETHYSWKYHAGFRRAKILFFLFERSFLSPRDGPVYWVSYYETDVRKKFEPHVLMPNYFDGWVNYFSAELDEGSPAENAESSGLAIAGKRERQYEIILAVCAALGYDPQQIPDGGKAKIKSACLTRRNLFTDSGFEHAWKERPPQLFKMANRETFLPK